MRRGSWTLAIILMGCATRGEGGERPVDAGPPMFADVYWETQCACSGGCAYPARDINNLDGEDGHEIACEVSGEPGGERTFALRAEKVGEYAFELRDVVFFGDGGDASGAGCTVRIEEGSDVYDGRCGSDLPSDSQPCQIVNIDTTADIDGFPQVTGELVCVGLEGVEVAAPATPFDTAGGCATRPDTEPVRFRAVNCRGL